MFVRDNSTSYHLELKQDNRWKKDCASTSRSSSTTAVRNVKTHLTPKYSNPFCDYKQIPRISELTYLRQDNTLPEMPENKSSCTNAPKFAARVRGLQNVGNTCYLSAVLQCLAHCDRFYSMIEKQAGQTSNLKLPQLSHTPQQGISRKASILADMYELLTQLWNPPDRKSSHLYYSSCSEQQRYNFGIRLSYSVSPSRIKAYLAQINPAFEGFQQQDAHEALQYLLNAMHEDCNHPIDHDCVCTVGIQSRRQCESDVEMLHNFQKTASPFQFNTDMKRDQSHQSFYASPPGLSKGNLIPKPPSLLYQPGPNGTLGSAVSGNQNFRVKRWYHSEPSRDTKESNSNTVSARNKICAVEDIRSTAGCRDYSACPNIDLDANKFSLKKCTHRFKSRGTARIFQSRDHVQPANMNRSEFIHHLRSAIEKEKDALQKFNLSASLSKLFDASPIYDTFEGWLQIERRCLACGSKEISFEQFLNLSLPIPIRSNYSNNRGGFSQLGYDVNLYKQSNEIDTMSLYNCFDDFVKPEVNFSSSFKLLISNFLCSCFYICHYFICRLG